MRTFKIKRKLGVGFVLGYRRCFILFKLREPMLKGVQDL